MWANFLNEHARVLLGKSKYMAHPPHQISSAANGILRTASAETGRSE